MSVPKGIQLAQRALHTARNNLRDGDTNAACNRAYYAAFRALKSTLNTAGLSAKTHKGTRTLFGKHFPDISTGDLTSSKIYAELERARLAADYGDEVIPSEEALNAVQRAEGFVTAILQRFFPEALRKEGAARSPADKVLDATEEKPTKPEDPQP